MISGFCLLTPLKGRMAKMRLKFWRTSIQDVISSIRKLKVAYEGVGVLMFEKLKMDLKSWYYMLRVFILQRLLNRFSCFVLLDSYVVPSLDKQLTRIVFLKESSSTNYWCCKQYATAFRECVATTSRWILQ